VNLSLSICILDRLVGNPGVFSEIRASGVWFVLVVSCFQSHVLELCWRILRKTRIVLAFVPQGFVSVGCTSVTGHTLSLFLCLLCSPCPKPMI
jgi:hypothetical protein